MAASRFDRRSLLTSAGVVAAASIARHSLAEEKQPEKAAGLTKLQTNSIKEMALYFEIKDDESGPVFMGTVDKVACTIKIKNNGDGWIRAAVDPDKLKGEKADIKENESSTYTAKSLWIKMSPDSKVKHSKGTVLISYPPADDKPGKK